MKEEKLEEAKRLYETANADQRYVLESLFPELAGSEDERIRKLLVEAVTQVLQDQYCSNRGVSKEKVLSWLEKQGEQKPTIEMKSPEESLGTDSETYNKIVDECIYGEQKVNYTTLVETGNGGINALVTKEITNGCDDEQKSFDYENANIPQRDFAPKVEPKFKVGDWVVNKGHSYLIVDIDFLDNRYLFEIVGYTHEQLNWEYIENADKNFHLWTIQDAKDGDVLMSRAPFIYGTPIPYGGLDWSNNNFIKASNFIFTDSPVHPATKEQRDQLKKAMADAGYTFDFEKKELKKIDARENLTLDGDLMQADCMIVEQKSWSEEEEVKINRIVACLENLNVADNDILLKDVDWLKSLKDRCTWKPSDEQMRTLSDVVHKAKYKNDISVGGYSTYMPLASLYLDLKKLREE